jgi:hypothetical protein
MVLDREFRRIRDNGEGSSENSYLPVENVHVELLAWATFCLTV